MNRIRLGSLWVLAFGLAAVWSLAVYADVSGEWQVNLKKGTRTEYTYAGESQEEAWAQCQAAIPQTSPTRTTYTCHTARYVAVVTPIPIPPTCPDKPSDSTRFGTCPTGTTGTWIQTSTYAQAPYPTCWVAGDWLPVTAPEGACKAPTPEPTDALFSDNFASGNLSKTQNGFRWGNRTATSVVDDPGNASGKALQFRFKAAASNSWAEQRFSLGGQHKDLWVRYRLVIPANYAHGTASTNNNKFLRLWSGDQNDGNDGYSRYCEKGGFSTFGKGGASSIGAEWGSDGDGVGTNTTSRIPDWLSFSDRGKEITYVMHVRVDSIGKPGAQNYPLNKGNGALEAWKNGKQFISLTDISWRCTRGAEYFTNGYVLGWANSGFGEEQEFLLREFSIATRNVFGVQ